MRVLLTTDTIGGVWTFTRELTEGLLNDGQAVALVSFGRAPSAEQNSWVDGTACTHGGSFHYEASLVPLEWMQDNEQAFDAAAPALLALMRRFKPDVIHSNQFCFGRLPASVPKLITAHSDVLSWASACRSDELEASPWLDSYISLVQTGLDGADVVVAPTAQMLAGLTQHFSVRCPSCFVPNGRTLSHANGTQGRLQQAVSVGRFWDEAKGLTTLLELNSPVPILIAGEEKFEAASAGIMTSQVRSLGLLSEDALLELFRQSSVYIASSIYEPFGLAPLEAALCGCAVLARDIPSFREVWGDAALYFCTAGELEQQLQALFAAPASLAAAQDAAKHRAEAFTAARMTASYLALYEDLIECGTSLTNVSEEFASHAA